MAANTLLPPIAYRALQCSRGDTLRPTATDIEEDRAYVLS
jgi:hypothetical protein